MRVLITGSTGFLGQYFLKAFEEQELIPLSHKDVNLEKKETIDRIISLDPDLIIHPAAIRSPDICEEEPKRAWMVNALGTKHIAIACGILDTPLIYISTDYVFSGEKEEPYTEFDEPNPINVYGRTKLEGEKFVKEFCKKHFIIRTSYVFGEYGNNAFHIVNKGIISRYDFACKVAELTNLPKEKIIPANPETFKAPAKRPLYSVLRNYILELYEMDDLPHYEESLRKCIKKLIIS